MTIKYFKKLANGETSISTKVSNFNLRIEEIEELKVRLEVSCGDKEKDEKYERIYFSKLYELQMLFSEIEEDNIVYFRGSLSPIVSNLKHKLEWVNIRK